MHSSWLDKIFLKSLRFCGEKNNPESKVGSNWTVICPAPPKTESKRPTICDRLPHMHIIILYCHALQKRKLEEAEHEQGTTQKERTIDSNQEEKVDPDNTEKEQV